MSRVTAWYRCSPNSSGSATAGGWPWTAAARRILPVPPAQCPVQCPPLSIPSCSPSSLARLSPSSRPAEPRKEPLVCCVSCSSSEFYSAPLTLADRPQGKGQKDNCLQQFCPQLVSPSACRAAQPARHCLTNNIKFNSRCCEKRGGGGAAEEIKLLGAASCLSTHRTPNRGRENRGS